MNPLSGSANRLSACGRALRPWLWRTLLPAAVLDPSGQASPAERQPCRTAGDRSVINRELRGKKDITLGRVAELAWAMGRIPFFDLPERKLPAGSNLPRQDHVPAAKAGTS